MHSLPETTGNRLTVFRRYVLGPCGPSPGVLADLGGVFWRSPPPARIGYFYPGQVVVRWKFPSFLVTTFQTHFDGLANVTQGLHSGATLADTARNYGALGNYEPVRAFVEYDRQLHRSKILPFLDRARK